jgi:hypothetical protein
MNNKYGVSHYHSNYVYSPEKCSARGDDVRFSKPPFRPITASMPNAATIKNVALEPDFKLAIVIKMAITTEANVEVNTRFWNEMLLSVQYAK